LVSFMFAPLVGGAEAQAEKQARQLQAFGHDVMIVTLKHYKKWKSIELLNGLPIIRVGGGIYMRDGRLRIGKFGHLPLDIAMFFTLWRLRHRYDVIHCLQLSPLAAVAAFIGRLTHKPVIICIPSTGPGKHQQESDASLMADTLTSANFLKVDYKEIVVGDIGYLSRSALGGNLILNYLRKSDVYYHILSSRSYSYLTSHGFNADHIVHIPNGVDIEQFRPDPERRPDPDQPERNILCVARLMYPKGIDVLLHAWGRMMHAPAGWRSHLKPRLLLAGEGTLQSQLERIARELDISDSVEFLGLRRDVIDLLQQAWGFVMPSRWEGMPNALLEAMACGLPCVATKVSGSEDIINDGVNGLLIEPEQPVALARALQRIIENTDLALQLSLEARATVLNHYQLFTIIKECEKLYHHLLTKDRVDSDQIYEVPSLIGGKRSS
ncbi:MAG TPA: glycosyltransferase, partial [Ktedonobacteraceae bacterium]|nr:glycosyltransferase [Ktedonobacteraceae bacterium]